MRLLIIEDDEDIVLALYRSLASLYKTDTASTAARGLQKISDHHYDVIILDLNLPDGSGLAVCEQVRASGTLLATGYALDSPQLRHLQRFFRHFLIARQLNDDAHDWETDLRHGHLSAVVSLLLGTYSRAGPVDLQAEQPALRQHFWQVTIGQVGGLINAHIRSARRALAQSGMVNEATFAGWLEPLEAASQQAVNGSREAQKFVYSYRQPGQLITR